MMRLFHHLAGFVLLVGVLTGCASSAQLAQRYNDRCVQRGLEPGTDAFRHCVAQLENDSAARRDARHREMVERSGVPSFGR
jgi:hypothetical protein